MRSHMTRELAECDAITLLLNMLLRANFNHTTVNAKRLPNCTYHSALY